MIKLGKLSIDPVQYAIAGNAVLGIKDSGKTYTSIYLAERLFEAGIPFITFDPIGVWRYMRIPGKGRGYPVVVAGPDGDLPLTVASAPEIVRAAMAGGVSLVLDLFDVNLSKADWRRIVTSCIKVLLHENKKHGLRHVFIEEAPEFIPQKPIDPVVYAEVEKLARMGGNSRLGYTLIGQRSQEIAKSVLELCESVFLHRQRGKNSLENMDKWLSIAGAEQQREIIKALPNLPQGECFAWIGGDDPKPPMLVKVPTKNSLHPDRRTMHGDTIGTTKPAADVSAFVENMRAGLARFAEEHKANDPAALRQQIAALTAQVKRLESAAPAPAKETIEAIRAEAFDQGRNHMRGIMASVEAQLSNALSDLAALLTRGKSIAHTMQSISDPPASQKPAAQSLPPVMPRKQFERMVGGATVALKKGERTVLIAVAQHPNGVDRAQLTLLTGYARSTRDAYLQRLAAAGHIEDGDRIRATADGIAALGADYEPLPTGRALQAYWLERLPEGERRVLKFAIDHYPQVVDRQRISDGCGYARSTRDAYLQRLSAREVIDATAAGVKASDGLF